MRRLIDEHAAPFARPGAAPRIAGVILLIAPAVQRDRRQHGPADLAVVNGAADALAWLVKAALADHAQGDAALIGRGDDAVAIGQ